MRYQKPKIIDDIALIKFIHICKKCETCVGLGYNAMLYVMEGIDGFKAMIIDPKICDGCGTPLSVKQLFAPSLIFEKGSATIAYQDYLTIFDRDKENGIHM